LGAFGAGCNEPTARPGTLNLAADTADQTLEHVRHYITRDGVQKSLIEADTAYFYEGSKSFELRVVTVTFFGETGDTSSILTAREATYRSMTGAMEGRGNVVVRSADGTRTLRSEKLDYDPGKNEISTDQHYVYDQGSNHLEGDSFTSDPNFQRVTTVKPRGRAAEGVVLPGQ
jgi:LPS export ABC transporter protein LptC